MVLSQSQTRIFLEIQTFALPVNHHPSSYADPHGRLFIAAEGRLFRGLHGTGAALCRKLIDEGVVDELLDRRLIVGTSLSSKVIAGYELVLEHERVPHVSYPYEWGAEMLRAAAIHTLDMLELLASYGYTLRDAHGWNVLFEGTTPVFVDFGSIIERPQDGAWQAEQEFLEYFLHPLAMMGEGHDRIARSLLRDFEQGVRISDCESIRGLGVPQRPSECPPFQWYRNLIAAYDFRPAQTAWAGYYGEDFPSFVPPQGWSGKHHAVAKILDEQRLETVLDIGSNSGWYALYAASQGAKVVAFDNDTTCINDLFVRARELNADVQALVMSFVNPSPRYGVGSGVMESSVERLGCQTVLALALVHHLVFRMHLTFPQIVEGLAAYTRNRLVVEFPPADDVHVRQWMSPRYDWYSLENFRSALGAHFSRIRVVESEPAPRVILVCDR
ncbi:MAG: hypothetical protein H7A44_11690 [Opitutaceae bacterium]|nr:hypothetical protein [Opitutaceae bacterium]